MALTGVQAGLPISQGLLPDEFMGPRALPITLSVSSSASVTFDLQKEIDMGQIDQIQAVYVDNSGNTSPVKIQSSEMSMTLVLGANKQGVLPIFGKALGQITITTANASATTIQLIFLNTPVPLGYWLAT